MTYSCYGINLKRLELFTSESEWRTLRDLKQSLTDFWSQLDRMMYTERSGAKLDRFLEPARQDGVHCEIWSKAWQISGASSTEWRTLRDLKQSLTDFWSQLDKIAYTARSEAELDRFLEPAQQNGVHCEIWSRAWQISGASSTECSTLRDLEQSLTDFWSQLNRMQYTERSEAVLIK